MWADNVTERGYCTWTVGLHEEKKCHINSMCKDICISMKLPNKHKQRKDENQKNAGKKIAGDRDVNVPNT